MKKCQPCFLQLITRANSFIFKFQGVVTPGSSISRQKIEGAKRRQRRLEKVEYENISLN